MPITIYPGTVKKRNPNGTYSDLVPGADANPQLANDIAEEYDPVAGVYSVGDYCIYQSVLYKCITAISTPEAFDSTKWTDVSVTDEIGGVKNTLTQLDGRVDSTQGTEAYVLGASTAGVTISGSGVYVIYNNALYTTTQSIASTDTAPYTGKITAVSGGGLNSLKKSIFTVTCWDCQSSETITANTWCFLSGGGIPNAAIPAGKTISANLIGLFAISTIQGWTRVVANLRTDAINDIALAVYSNVSGSTSSIKFKALWL